MDIMTTPSMEIELSPKELLLKEFKENPFTFFYEAWGLLPQPAKPQARFRMQELLVCDHKRFEEIASSLHIDDFEPFIKHKHLTWQQTVIIIAYHRAFNRTLPQRVAILTGRGLGKSMVTSLIEYHFLYTNPAPIISVTAPTSIQLFGALHKEANQALANMNKPYSSMFEWSTEYIRRTDLPYTYYSRCKTANDISALRGTHSDQQMCIADEATGVDEDVIDNGWQTMTSSEKVLILISNPEGNNSLIERIFEEDDSRYVKLSFSALDSPIVDQQTIKDEIIRLASKGIKAEDDRDFSISILGRIPKQSATIEGYYRLFSDSLIDKMLEPVGDLDEPTYLTRPAFGVDVGAEGGDSSDGVLRSFKWAKLMFEQPTSTKDSVAGAIDVILDTCKNLTPQRTFYDAFGVGHDIGLTVLSNSSDSNKKRITPVLLSDRPIEPYNTRYLNLRSVLYDTFRKWAENGGRIEIHDLKEQTAWKNELRSIYVRKVNGKLQIMSKDMMRTKGFKSPNKTDAMILSFTHDYQAILDGYYRDIVPNRNNIITNTTEPFDKFSPIP